MKGILFCLFVSFSFLPGSTAAQDASRIVGIGQKSSLISPILGEERPYWVYLPASYANKAYTRQRYPVLYLLDGAAHFHSVSGIVQYMSNGLNGNVQIPELIVVAIPNTDRNRDLTPTHTTIGFDGKEDPSLASSGGGEAFLKFMREELFSHIESSYRTLPYRILVGHSSGGLTGLQALVQSPSMFQAYIAIDPGLWWDNQVLVRMARTGPRQPPARDTVVYMSSANIPPLGSIDTSIMRKSIEAFANLLDSWRTPQLRSTLQYFDAEDHLSVPLLSLYQGLLYVFERYKPSVSDTIARPASVVAHFAEISKRLGIDLRPPEGFINVVGYETLYTTRDVDKAIELFRLNVSNYPDSSNVYASLAEGYMVKGEKQLAIQNYQESLRLNPDNQNAKDRLDKLRAQ